MSGKKYFLEKENDLGQNSQVVGATDTFAASDYLVDNSMDNIEGIIGVKSTAPMMQKFQRKTTSGLRGFSADSMIQTNQQFVQHSMKKLKVLSPKNIKSPTTSSSTIAPYVFIVGPVRVQTVQKIDGRPMNKLFVDEMLELYGSGVKYPSKELINIKPKILKSLPTAAKNIPITVQSVRLGHDYVRIDRKIEIDRSKIKLQPSLNTKEVVKFGCSGLAQESQEVKPSRKSKSEATILKTPVFNLIGPLIITAFQNALHDANGGYKIYEEIELRADGSTAKPEIAVVPFLRKVSLLPKNEKEQIPIKYREDILIGYNVMLIKRLIEIEPSFRKQLQDFSLSEERNYMTDKTVCTGSSVTGTAAQSAAEKRKMLVLQDPPIRTDFTVSDGSSAELTLRRAREPAFLEPQESILQRDRKSKTERSLRTALGSSEMINAGNLCKYSCKQKRYCETSNLDVADGLNQTRMIDQ
ncbi:unnamed protein product [Litomosoides sigmodontis]|uniref:Uncharacterized protein n=1 Tax=Litomosoides sigmodontis TaxID=42156 RepID=A0A3P6T6J1_LITSI|nr:unnamed protein product [Litomosoides sigmodontis]